MMDLRVKIKKHRRKLSEKLDLHHGLLDECMACKLSSVEIDEIKCTRYSVKQNEKLLDFILEKNSCNEFIKALKNSKQTHVANFIEGDGEYNDDYVYVFPLSDRETNQLDAHRRELIDRMDVDSGMIDYLFSKKVLTSRHIESIRVAGARHRKVEVFLDILKKGSLNDYKLTIEALKECIQSDLAKLLEPERDELIVKQIQSDLERVTACLKESLSKIDKLSDGKKELLKMVANTEDAIKKRTNELMKMIDMENKSLLDNLSVVTKEKLKMFENEEQENNEMLTSFESLKKHCNKLMSEELPVNFLQSAQETHARADELEKRQQILLQRQIPSFAISFSEEFLQNEKIIGNIEDKSESPAVKDKKVIVVGTSDGKNVHNEIFEFNLYSPNEVSHLESIPTRIQGAAVAVTYRDKLFVIGMGKDADEIWKLEGNTWTKCASLCQGRQRHCANIVHGRLFISGGRHSLTGSEKVLNTVETYDFSTKKCSTVGELVLGIQNFASASYKSSIYIFGGILEGNTKTRDVQIYDTIGNTCSLFSKPMPSERSNCRALLWSNSVILLNPNTCFIFDFEMGTWKERNHLKTDVINFGLILDDGKVFVFGGGMNEVDKHGKTIWNCRNDIRWVRLVDIIKDNSVKWKQLGHLPKQTLIYAYA